MKAYNIPNLRFSLVANEVIEPHRFVTVGTNSYGKLPVAKASVIGVSTNRAKAGEVLEIADGIIEVEAASVVQAGDLVMTDEHGKAATADVLASAVGIAITGAAAAGEFVTVKIG